MVRKCRIVNTMYKKDKDVFRSDKTVVINKCFAFSDTHTHTHAGTNTSGSACYEVNDSCSSSFLLFEQSKLTTLDWVTHTVKYLDRKVVYFSAS